jgi:hypothetical protein
MEQRMDGRGYYLCRSMDCLRKGAKKLALPDGSEGMDRLKTFILHGV